MSNYEPQMLYEYNNGTFEGGLVTESKHEQNVIYLTFQRKDNPEHTTWTHEFTLEEAACIISILGHAIMATQGILEPIECQANENE